MFLPQVATDDDTTHVQLLLALATMENFNVSRAVIVKFLALFGGQHQDVVALGAVLADRLPLALLRAVASPTAVRADEREQQALLHSSLAMSSLAVTSTRREPQVRCPCRWVGTSVFGATRGAGWCCTSLALGVVCTVSDSEVFLGEK